MDDIDRSIVSHLEVDARLTMFELGERVGLSTSPTHRRVKALEASGAIRGYHASIDPAMTGRGFEVFVSVWLSSTDPKTVKTFETDIAKIDAIRSCHRMFGEPDYLVLVAVADLHAYEVLWAQQLSALRGTSRVSSQMTMKVVKAPRRR
jgi:Lrp/AsnC family transcriptional regulator, leucine-responsive regulatory protein